MKDNLNEILNNLNIIEDCIKTKTNNCDTFNCKNYRGKEIDCIPRIIYRKYKLIDFTYSLESVINVDCILMNNKTGETLTLRQLKILKNLRKL